MSNYNEKMFSKEMIEDTTKKSKRKIRKWVKGAVALTIALGVTITSLSLFNTILADKLANDLASGLDEAKIVMRNDEDNPDNVTHGYIDTGLDEFAKDILTMAEFGQIESDILAAAIHYKADYAHGYKDEIATMDEIFKRTHSLIAGHEDEYPEEILATFNYPRFEDYLEANNTNVKDYHSEAKKLLILAAKHGCNSQEIYDFLNEHGFINGSGGRYNGK